MNRILISKKVRRGSLAIAGAAFALVGGLTLGAGSVSAQADVGITITDGVTTVNQSGALTYTIVVDNPGTEAATATVAVVVPALLTSVSWTCSGTNGGDCVTGSGSGSIQQDVILPAGSSVTFVLSATVVLDALGTISVPATVVSADDPNPANDAATDVDTILAAGDLSITKTDVVTTATPGGSVTYTITVANDGPDNASGVTVVDVFPLVLTATWTCVGAGGGTCTAAGTGNVNDIVNLPAGGSVTYTASANIAASAVGTLSNTATVTAPAGLDDVDLTNNSATDSDALAAAADLTITKTDNVTTATAGGSVTYTITASNAGPSDAPGATVADTFPAALSATWTCVGAGGGTCTASGTGNISDTVNLPAGGSVTYTATAALSASATGTLSNTATVTAPGGVDDLTPGNNSATDVDVIVAGAADLSISKSGPSIATAGTTATYTLSASNLGPDAASNVTVTDVLPAGVTFVSLVQETGLTATTTTPAVGATGTVTLNWSTLASGQTATFTLVVTIGDAFEGSLLNTASIASGTADATTTNNSSSATIDVAATTTTSTTSTTTTTTTTTTTLAPTTTTTTTLGPTTTSTSTSTTTTPSTAATTTTIFTGALPATGGDPSNLGLAVVILLAAGAVLIVIARRRTHPTLG